MPLMADDFLIVGITLPAADVEGEATRIVELLASGAVDRMHLRKPDAGESVLRKLLDAIPREYHSRLSLHDAPWLTEEYPAVGFHLNSRYPGGVSAAMLSRSCHSLDEVAASGPELDYVTLSPVYDSISKPGYRGTGFAGNQPILSLRKVVALGGVTPGRFGELNREGFSGAAMLGYLWNPQRSVADIAYEIKCKRKFQ